MPIDPKKSYLCVLILAAMISSLGCSKKAEEPRETEQPARQAPAKSADGTIGSGAGIEREKPAPGTGNLQGKVFYNEKPAENIEVKLCETFSQFLGGCSGETFTALTDGNGEYLIKNIPPKIYESLNVKVFNTGYYIFVTSGIIQAAKYKIEAGKTFFAPDTNLFKADLKLLSPQAGAQVDANNLEVKWEPYPDASYYKLSIHADTMTGAKTEYDYIGRRIDGVAFTLDKPLAPGTYSCKVEAFNANGIKLADNSDEVKFTVKSAAAP